MDEQLRAIRRRRRRERRMLRRIWNLAPVVLVALAWLLSAGVVKLMEVKRPPSSEARAPAAPRIAQPGSEVPAILSAPDTRPELSALIGTSILDDEVSGTPESGRPASSADPADAALVARLDELGRREREVPDDFDEAELVPEPGVALLLAASLLGVVASERRRSSRSA